MSESDPALCTGHYARQKAVELTQSNFNELRDPLGVAHKKQEILIYCIMTWQVYSKGMHSVQ